MIISKKFYKVQVICEKMQKDGLVIEREGNLERKREKVCVRVCVREREKKKKEREREREGGGGG